MTYFITIGNETMEVDRETFYASAPLPSLAEEARDSRNTANEIYARLLNRIDSSENTKSFIGFRKYSNGQKQAKRLLNKWYRNTLNCVAKRDFMCLFCEPSMECLEGEIERTLNAKDETKIVSKLGVLTLGALVTVLGAHLYENKSQNMDYETQIVESVDYQKPTFTSRNDPEFNATLENVRKKNFDSLLENVRNRYPNDKRLEDITDYSQDNYFTLARIYVDNVKKQVELK